MAKDLPLVNVREHDHHAVALLILYVRRMLAALFGRFARSGKLYFFLFTCLADPDHGKPVAILRALASMTSKPKVSYPGISIWNFSQGFSYLSVPRPLLFMESGTGQSPDLFQCPFFGLWRNHRIHALGGSARALTPPLLQSPHYDSPSEGFLPNSGENAVIHYRTCAPSPPWRLVAHEGGFLFSKQDFSGALF